MASPTKAGFSRRTPDHLTDELVIALSGCVIYDFKELFLKVHAGLKLKSAGGGDVQMLRLRCYEKLRKMMDRGVVEKTGNTYGGRKGIEQMSSAFRLAKADAAVAARVAKAS